MMMMMVMGVKDFLDYLDLLQKGDVVYVLLQVEKGEWLFPELFALQEVETSHVLFQRFDTKTIGVFQSSFLFDRCGCISPLSPVLWGNHTIPL